MRACILCYFIICLSFPGAAQTNADTLSNAEKEELRQALFQTPLGANFLADRYSQKGDSSKAGEYLVKSDPHYLIYLGQTPESLPEFLSRFKSSKADKDKYIEAFTRLYNAPKNTYYTTFKKMRAEDQALRNRSNNCNEKELCKQLSREMRTTDSIHAAYLYNYIVKNGWPTLENGGLHAAIAAIHDHSRHAFYIPYLKKAIREGQAILDPLEILSYYNASSIHGDALKTYLDTSAKSSFDVSSLISFRLPSSIPEIRKVVNEHCPVEYYLVFYGYKDNIAPDWYDAAQARGNRDPEGHIIGQFFYEIKKQCVKKPPEILKGAWAIHYLPSETRRSKIMLYVVYK